MQILNLIVTSLNFNCIIKNVSYFFLNAIRNFLITKIKNYSINSLIIFLNTSVLNDEVIAHRIGLIPIVNNCLFEKTYQCGEIVKIFLEINYTCVMEKIYLLNSNSIILDSNFLLIYPYGYSTIRKTTELNEKQGFVITKLKFSQSLNARIYLEKNEGNQHTKWAFCSGILFSKLPMLKWNFLLLNAINFLEKNNFNKLIFKYKINIHLGFQQVMNLIIKVLLRKINNIDSDKEIFGFVTLLRDLKILEFNNSKNYLLKFETNGTLITKYSIISSIEKILKSVDTLLNNFKWKTYKKRDSNP